MSEHSTLFYKKIDHYYSDPNKKKPWTAEELQKVAADILQAKQTPGKKTRRQYYLLSLYDVVDISEKRTVVRKQKRSEDDQISIVCYEDLFDILNETHISTGHGGRDKMIHNLQKKYDIARYAVEQLIETCVICKKKKNKYNTNLIVKPVVPSYFNSQGQVDVIDFQSCPDGDFQWLLNYRDGLTKFVFLRPLTSKTTAEIAKELLKIFLEVGAPGILQIGNGFECTNLLLSELIKLWPMLAFMLGHPRHPQVQGSIERSSQEVENTLRAWMCDHKSTNWSLGCYFVQFEKNTSHNKIIGRTPYKALFGVDPKMEMLPKHSSIPTEKEEVNSEELEANIKIEKNIKVENLSEDENDGKSMQEAIENFPIGNFVTVVMSDVSSTNVKIKIEDSIEKETEVGENIQGVTENIPVENFLSSRKSAQECNNEKLQNMYVTCHETKTEWYENEKPIEENGADRGQKRAAEGMVSDVKKKLSPLEIDT